jgi:hypothetical protein
MKNLLLIACAAGALLAASAVPSLAGDLTRPAEILVAANACQTSCRASANNCREQCAHPEDPEQCIVSCSKSECNASCDEFEKACNRHCDTSKGG